MEKKRMNDKGFSLVELIIVIAIMAILIGLLAPQYLKFVERSKKSADRDTVDEIIRAVQMDYADPESAKNVDNQTITLSTSAAATVGGTSSGNDLKAVLESFGLNLAEMKLKSTKWIAVAAGAAIPSSPTYASSITITFKYTGETVTATVTANGGTNVPVDDTNTIITGKSNVAAATPTP